jgi:hypothetical protein
LDKRILAGRLADFKSLTKQFPPNAVQIFVRTTEPKPGSMRIPRRTIRHGHGVPVGRSEETCVDSPVPETDDPSGPSSSWPRISDYWPDAPHRLGPPADHYELPGVDATRTSPAVPPRPAPRSYAEPAGDDRTGRDLKPVLLLILVVLLVGGGVFAVVSRLRPSADEPAAGLPAPPLPVVSATEAPATQPASPPVSVGTSPPPTRTSPPPDRTPAAPAPPAQKKPAAATLELADGVTQLRVVTGDLDDGVVKVAVGADSTIKARTEIDDDTVRVSVAPSGRKQGSASLEITLSDEVTWSFRMRGGVNTAGIDLSGGRVGDIELIGGAGTVDLVLPTQRDAIAIAERGGLGTWRIVTDGEVPVRALFREGAGSVTVYGDADAGVGRGEQIRAGRGDGGIRLDSAGGVGALTVQAR